MSMENEQPSTNQPSLVPPPDSKFPPTQSWTLDGYPIVDGKYLDQVTGEIKVHSGLLTSGPPSLAVYWHNRLSTGQENQFYALSASSSCSLSDYLIRVGKFLTTETCTIDSLNATTYSVNVVVMTELSTSEFSEALRKHKLIYCDDAIKYLEEAT